MALAYQMVDRRIDTGTVVTDITLDGSYPSGGYALSNQSLGMLSTPVSVDFGVKTAQGFAPCWDVVNNKLKMFKSAGAAGPQAECAAGDLSTSVVIRATVRGTPIT